MAGEEGAGAGGGGKVTWNVHEDGAEGTRKPSRGTPSRDTGTSSVFRSRACARRSSSRATRADKLRAFRRPRDVISYARPRGPSTARANPMPHNENAALYFGGRP